MKKLIYLSLAAVLGLGACGGDDNNVDVDDPIVEPPPPPAPVVTDVDKAGEIILGLGRFDPETGDVDFSLTDADGNPVVNAKHYNIVFMGFPDNQTNKSLNPKAWQRWHVYYKYDCAAEGECSGTLSEEADTGKYQFRVTDLDWEADAATGSVINYKVSVIVNGALASNSFELFEPKG
ncbi:hypothetical protein [Paraferrimonas sedimenticola]|uniref:Lipoprotein n=1 Tax=Paraferrimonas sedimenticola TaxID=375674 RepID=A0AA37RVH7_9GAMM|nr:hypothetical protein [Paraferrimonas sedimenticola]GLP96455.1 lipoprotein [Paraferrimonas sedimenticola]